MAIEGGFDPERDLIFMIVEGRPVLFEDFVQDNIKDPDLPTIVQSMFEEGYYIISSPPFFSIDQALTEAIAHEVKFPEGENAPMKMVIEPEQSLDTESEDTSYSSESEEEDEHKNKKIKV
jgi:hypothetical protein